MSWPYTIQLDLIETQKHERRVLLDRYGVYAQLSALVPIIAYQLYRLGLWVYSERQRAQVVYEAVPSSPGLKQKRLSRAGGVVRRQRKLVWWLESELAPGWGLRGQWIAIGSWVTWLLFLCVHRTSDDYLHITKRFGIVAASQFPIHYMLAMKSRLSPLALFFKTSHEQLNPWHRLSGRVIYFLLLCHVSWYFNFFIQVEILGKRLVEPVVIIGILAMSMMTTIMSTSLEKVRRWSYRVFFLCHLVIGVSILPLLFFHAPHLRIYISEALAIFFIDLTCRKLDSSSGFATIAFVPNTTLVKVRIPLPTSRIKRFKAVPGQHVYLQIPAESRTTTTSKLSIHEFLFNPFTVASVSATDVTLILRTLHGPTTQAIGTLAHLTKAKPPINIEGPLGSSRHFPNLAAGYDRILLIAGGVGATFILPIYRSLKNQLSDEGKSLDRVKFIWSMRDIAEASWDFEPEEGKPVTVEQDENMKIYVTEKKDDGPDAERGVIPAGSLEMDELHWKAEDVLVNGGFERPDLTNIIDEVFRKGNEERVAVLVCGPQGMARVVRKSVGGWVEREGSREVWFHDESFGW